MVLVIMDFLIIMDLLFSILKLTISAIATSHLSLSSLFLYLYDQVEFVDCEQLPVAI